MSHEVTALSKRFTAALNVKCEASPIRRVSALMSGHWQETASSERLAAALNATKKGSFARVSTLNNALDFRYTKLAKGRVVGGSSGAPGNAVLA